MINVSNIFRNKVATGNRNWLSYADITFPDGQESLALTNAEIWASGFEVEDSVSEDDMFTALGSTNIGSGTLVINNMSGAYTDYDFTNARVVLSVGMEIFDNGTSRVEKVQKGVYTVDETTYNGGTIRLSLLDNMSQFDRPYSLSHLSYPATLAEIVRNACSLCGVSLATYTFRLSDTEIQTRPKDDAVTFREVIGWAACIAGCFARINRFGELEIKWFTMPSDITQRHNIRSLYSQDMSMDDVIITGVNLVVKDETESATEPLRTYSRGTSGYVIVIEGNELIDTTSAPVIVNTLGNILIGLRFRKASVTHLGNPTIEAGDYATLRDKKGVDHTILVTRTNFSPTSPQTTVCGAETPARNSATRYGWATKAYVDSRKLLNQERSIREDMMEQLSDRLSEHSGLYSTVEAQQSGGSIYYLHDMPTLAESKIVWKMTRDAWGVTTNYDGDDTVWNAGMTVDGDAIVRILSAIGVDADWITTGTIRSRNGRIAINLEDDTLSIQGITDFTAFVTGSDLSTSGRTTINGSNITTGIIQDANQNTVINLSTGALTMNKGSINIGSGTFQVDTLGNLTATSAEISGKITSILNNEKLVMDESILTGYYNNNVGGKLDLSAYYNNGHRNVSLYAFDNMRLQAKAFIFERVQSDGSVGTSIGYNGDMLISPNGTFKLSVENGIVTGGTYV